MARKKSSGDASPEQATADQGTAKKKRRRASAGKTPPAAPKKSSKARGAGAPAGGRNAARKRRAATARQADAGRAEQPGGRRGRRTGDEADRLRQGAAPVEEPEFDFDDFEDAEPSGGYGGGYAADDHDDEESGWGAVLNPSTVVRIFREAGRPLSRKDILKAAGLPKSEKRQLYDVLGELLDQGRLIKVKGAYGLTESMRLVTGVFSVQRSGVAFLIPDDKKRQDILIRPGNFGDAWHGDRVAVAVQPVRSGRRAEGRVARVVERMTKELTVRVVKRLGGNLFLCLPTDPKLQMHFMLDADHAERIAGEDVKPGDVLGVAPEEKLERDLWSAKASRLYGQESDVAVQESLVKLNHSIPTEFPADVLAEAERLPELPSEEDFQDRRDLRGMGFVTIDGAKARDFDDAVLVEKDGRGYRLFVAIADVSHYVRQGSALDREAAERANSYYFPQSVEPMFPERLSNGLCSLNPRVPRLAMVVETRFTAKGEPGESRFYPAVIESKFRLTYSQVNRAVILKDEAERKVVAPVLPMLELAETLARQIKARRSDRGSLDFDLPEPEILFNLQGETVDIRPKARNFAHQIVEEFMIAANEAVARHLTELELPCLYRVHGEPSPEKLETLYGLLSKSSVGAKLPEPGESMTPKDMQGLLKAAEGTDMEFLVNRLMLRTMMQAKYSPDNEGHFGLASECYCHFTSPIRRYADLVVHRSLRQALTGVPMKAGTTKALRQLAEHLSLQERKGIDAEREILKRITVLFLQDKVGETFNGVISSITDFGFWVDLKEVMADGLVRLSSITDDYYAFIPERMELLGQRTGRMFKLGQSVVVELTEVNLGRLEVTLSLSPEGALPAAKRAEEAVQAVNGVAVKTGKRRRPPKGAPTPEPALEVMSLGEQELFEAADELAEAIEREAREEARTAKTGRRGKKGEAKPARTPAKRRGRAETVAAEEADGEAKPEATAGAVVEAAETLAEAAGKPDALAPVAAAAPEAMASPEARTSTSAETQVPFTASTATSAEAQVSSTATIEASEPLAKPKRTRRKAGAAKTAETSEAGTKPKRSRAKAKTAEAAEEAPAEKKRPSRKAEESEAAAPAPKTAKARGKKAAEPTQATPEEAAPTAEGGQPVDAAPAKPKRARAKTAKSGETAPAAKPSRQSTRKTKTDGDAETSSAKPAAKKAPDEKPARSRKKKATKGESEE